MPDDFWRLNPYVSEAARRAFAAGSPPGSNLAGPTKATVWVPGHHVTLPGAALPFRVERVVLMVELTTEAPEGLEAALAGGWTAVVPIASEPKS